MEAEELRLGNYIDYFGKVVIVAELKNDSNTQILIGCKTKPNELVSICNTSDGSFGGIPLTEEWLVKFGFTDYEWCTDCAFIKFNGGNMMLRYFNEKWHCTKTRVTKDSKGHSTHGHKDIVKKGLIKYVHQLQNLYFALTGGELSNQL